MKTRKEVIDNLLAASCSIHDAMTLLGAMDHQLPMRDSRIKCKEQYGILWLDDILTMVNQLYDWFEKDGPPVPLYLGDEISHLAATGTCVIVDEEQYVHLDDVQAVVRELAPDHFSREES